jgi:hypothetical protein
MENMPAIFPRVPLRSTRGYTPRPRWGRGLVVQVGTIAFACLTIEGHAGAEVATGMAPNDEQRARHDGDLLILD